MQNCVSEYSNTKHFVSSRSIPEGEGGLIFGGGVRCFALENEVLKFICSLKFTNFLKDVNLHVKQLKFILLAHSMGCFFIFFMQSRGVKVFCVLLGVLKFFHSIPTPNLRPPW